MLENDTQIKVKINDFQKMKNLLKSKGAIFLGGWQETILRFDTEKNTLEKNNRFFRIKMGNENIVTLKEPINDRRNKFFQSNNMMFQVDDVESFCYIMKEIAIIRNPQTNEYLCEDSKVNNCRSFVQGGIEDGETIEQATLREILEETGYKNIKINAISEIPFINHFFAAWKMQLIDFLLWKLFLGK